MTPEERLHAFHTHGEDVQKYEIVPIHWPRLQRRGADAGTGIRMKAFGEDIKLWLSPTEGTLVGHDTPVYSLEQRTSGPHFLRHKNVIKNLEYYEDLKKSAVVVVSRTAENTRRIVGTVGSRNLIIAPIPERLIKKVRRQRQYVDNISETERDDHHYHIVYKKSLARGKVQYLKAPKVNSPPAQPSSIPDVVYPEVLVVVANDLHEKLGGTIPQTVAYMIAFWNGVDLKYRSLENPKFRLNIAGIVVSKDDKALTYITQHKYRGESLIGDDVWRASGDYWLAQENHIPFDSYDVLVTITSHPICRYDKGTNYCRPGTDGLAMSGGACNVRKVYRAANTKVSLVRDLGGFDGIHGAAHELGHLFGAEHDGTENTECSMADGHIMNPTIPFSRSPDWSNCTLKDFQRFLNKNPVCLYNNPIQRSVLPRYLPGKFMDADAQCMKFVGTKACTVDYRICGRLGCVIEGDDKFCTQILGGAADGTSCGPDHICLHGRCIEESSIWQH
ncbi:A disintegrin and metalloproteinase with thrombospondin motifs like isoform X2 [Diachasmimorpha longicaudata]